MTMIYIQGAEGMQTYPLSSFLDLIQLLLENLNTVWEEKVDKKENNQLWRSKKHKF